VHSDFKDIRCRISEEPTWFDMGGIPRYGEFSPEMISNIYAHTVFLVRIACQACGEEFLVAMHFDVFDRMPRPKELHYGDPPRHDDCMGDTMNCDDLEIVQAWHKEGFKWYREREWEEKIDE
jgi:hypothetical protein